MPVNVDLSTPGRRGRRACLSSTRMPFKASAFLGALYLALENVQGQLESSSLLLRSQDPSLASDDLTTRALAEEVGDAICKNPGSFLGVGNTYCLNKHLRTAVFLLAVIVLVSIFLERVIHFCRLSIKCPQLRLIVNRMFEEMMIMGFLSMIIFSLNTSGSLNSLDMDDLTSKEQLYFYEFFHYIVFLTMVYFIIIVLLLLFIGTVVPKLIWNIKRHPVQGRESVSDIHIETYDGRYPSTSDRDDCGTGRSRRSLPRASSRYSTGSTYLDEGEQTGEIPSEEYYASMRARGRSDADMLTRMTSTRGRSSSGMDLVMGSRAYSLLLQRYQREGWWFRFNLRKQWSLWKSFEILAYNICQNRSGYIYKNPAEMDRLFGVRPARSWTQQAFDDDEIDEEDLMTYAKYHVLCMRNLLFHMTNIHPTVFLVLIVICLLPSIFPDQDHWIFIGVGCSLLLLNVCIFFKVLQILRGIVDDRLHIITSREIHSRLKKARSQARRRKRSEALPVSRPQKSPLMKFKAAALVVRSIIRMQMSALCHRQLHYHDERFWFKSPKLLLRLFQVATIGQAFYLVWLSLVEIQSMTDAIPADGGGPGLLALMFVFPALALLIMTPMTMPSLVLVMSLTGIFVDLNASNGKVPGKSHKVTREDLTTHTRIMRRSYLRSNYSETGYQTPGTPQLGTNRSSIVVDSSVPGQHDAVPSPSNVLFRAYDSPVSPRRNSYRNYPGNSSSVGRDSSLMTNTSGRWRNLSRSVADDGIDTSGRTFNLAAFQSMNSPSNNNEEYPDRQSSASFCSTSGRSPRSFRVDQTIPGTPVNGNPEHSAFGEQVVNNAEENNNNEQVDGQIQPMSPVGGFKTFCSKYGGYPDK